MQVPAPEFLLCDTSYLGHAERQRRRPADYQHWSEAALERIASAVLGIAPFTVAEVRVGQERAGWGKKGIAESETLLQSYVLVPLDEPTLGEWVALRVHCLDSGLSLSENDLWIAAAAISRDVPLVTCDERQSNLPSVEAIHLPPPRPHRHGG